MGKNNGGAVSTGVMAVGTSTTGPNSPPTVANMVRLPRGERARRVQARR